MSEFYENTERETERELLEWREKLESEALDDIERIKREFSFELEEKKSKIADEILEEHENRTQKLKQDIYEVCFV